MGGVLVLLYGVVCYGIFFLTFCYLCGWVGDLVVPRSIDTGRQGGTPAETIIVDAVLVGLFGVQHSVMARPWFKRRWTKIVPPSVERSTFVLIASLLLVLMMWQWRAWPRVVWDIEQPVLAGVLWALFGLGWVTVLYSTLLINHFDLFGLRQVWIRFRGGSYEHIGFRTPALYKLVRHPLMLGFIVGFWATPRMTAGHLLFAAATTVYILVAIRIEERDLVTFFGERYVGYRQRVRSLIPIPRSRSGPRDSGPAG